MKIVAYTPVAGLTIEQAIDKAIQVAQQKNCTVITVINDIVMFVDKKTNPKQAVIDYRDKVNLRYYVERIQKVTLR